MSQGEGVPRFHACVKKEAKKKKRIRIKREEEGGPQSRVEQKS